MRSCVLLCCLIATVGVVVAQDVSSGTEEFKLLPGTRVSPAYPPSALAARFEGTVVLAVEVRPDGLPGEIEVLDSSHPRLGFEEAAIEAIRQWRFEPARENGEPVAAATAYALSFRVPPRGSHDAAYVAGIHLDSVKGPIVGFPSAALAPADGAAPNRWIGLGQHIWAVEIPGCGREMCVYDRADFQIKPPHTGLIYPWQRQDGRTSRVGSTGELSQSPSGGR